MLVAPQQDYSEHHADFHVLINPHAWVTRPTVNALPINQSSQGVNGQVSARAEMAAKLKAGVH